MMFGWPIVRTGLEVEVVGLVVVVGVVQVVVGVVVGVAVVVMGVAVVGVAVVVVSGAGCRGRGCATGHQPGCLRHDNGRCLGDGGTSSSRGFEFNATVRPAKGR
jgi:hypothetical protein